MREKLSIAICDDTAADRKIISSYILNYLDQHGYVADLTEYDSGEKLLESDVSSYNLIVLDIFFGGQHWDPDRQRAGRGCPGYSDHLLQYVQ